MKWIESVRTDIECFFGLLKSRFRFLRNAISQHNPKTVTKCLQNCGDIAYVVEVRNDLSDINCTHQFKDGNYRGNAGTFKDDSDDVPIGDSLSCYNNGSSL